MSKYVMLSTVSNLSGFSTLLTKGLVSNDKRTLLVKRQGEFVKLSIDKLDEFKEYVAKFATTTPEPVIDKVRNCPKHFTPTADVDYNKSPMSQMKYGSKVGTVGVVLANSNGNGYYLHTIASISNILYREDSIQGKDRDSIVKLLTYANKHFLTVDQYITALDTLKAIYKNGSTELCKRIIKSLWVNVDL